MRTLSLQLIAATALLLCTGCTACYDNFMRFEAWKTEKCCNLFHCNHRAAPAAIYAPIAAPVVQQCPQPIPVAAAPCAQPAPICAPIQCDPCANAAAAPAAAPCCPQQAVPCCPQVCCPPVCMTECCPSACSVSYGGMSGCDSCGSGGGVIVSETPGYTGGGTTIQGNPQLAPSMGPAPIVPGR